MPQWCIIRHQIHAAYFWNGRPIIYRLNAVCAMTPHNVIHPSAQQCKNRRKLWKLVAMTSCSSQWINANRALSWCIHWYNNTADYAQILHLHIYICPFDIQWRCKTCQHVKQLCIILRRHASTRLASELKACVLNAQSVRWERLDKTWFISS